MYILKFNETYRFAKKNSRFRIDFRTTLHIFAQDKSISPMKTTLSTIAENSGFSKSTVSRVLNGTADSSRISQDTINKIKKAAEECGYTPNLIAKNLRTNKTHTIGLLVPSISNPYFADITSVIISEARRLGYTTIVTDTMEDEKCRTHQFPHCCPDVSTE